MAYSEYADLSTEERAAVLSALATLALGNETLRDHFNSLAENMPPRQLGKVCEHATTRMAGADQQSCGACITLFAWCWT